MTDTPQVLLAHHLKRKLPTFLREYDKLARQCAISTMCGILSVDRVLIDRERRMVERRDQTGFSPPSKASTAST